MHVSSPPSPLSMLARDIKRLSDKLAAAEVARFDGDVNAAADVPLLISAVTVGKPLTIVVLGDRGADPEQTTGHGWKALCTAAWYNNGTAPVLLRTFPRIDVNGRNTADDDRRTPLHIAACYGHRNIAALLLEHGASIELLDATGRTPEQVARACGRTSVAQLVSRWVRICRLLTVSMPLHPARFPCTHCYHDSLAD